MASNDPHDPNDPYELGRVETTKGGNQPPTSSLVEALAGTKDDAADAIVLRGYLGRSDILQRANDYLRRAKKPVGEKAFEAGREAGTAEREADKAAAAAAAAPGDDALAARAKEAAEKRDEAKEKANDAKEDEKAIDDLIQALEGNTENAKRHVPWRIYLTPQLDSYVDFHLTDLIAFRREPRTERRDTCTVWLKPFGTEGKPIPYRVVQETRIGPSFSVYLGGDLVDDYLGSSGASSAWGDQSSAFGRKPGTGTVCGAFGRKPGTGTVCGD